MTKSDLDTERMSAGFDFSKRLIDPKFRKYLKALGWESGRHVVPALDGDSIGEVIGRMGTNGTPPPCLIAIPKEQEPFGFWFLVADLAPSEPKRRFSMRMKKAPRVPTIRINPTSTIGMLYDALQPCGDYLPSDWSHPLRFARASAPS